MKRVYRRDEWRALGRGLRVLFKVVVGVGFR